MERHGGVSSANGALHGQEEQAAISVGSALSIFHLPPSTAKYGMQKRPGHKAGRNGQVALVRGAQGERGLDLIYA